MESRVAII